MGQTEQERRAVLIVEDDAAVRQVTVALLEDGHVDTIECESAEAALAVMLMGGREVGMIFADVRLPGAMDGIDLAWEVKLRWPDLPMILTSGNPPDRGSDLPPGVIYMPKPWPPHNVLVAAEEAIALRIDRCELPPAKVLVLPAKNRSWSLTVRFFFHVTNGDTFKDEEGEERTGPEDAKTRADKIASELSEAREFEKFTVVVTDEQGNELARVAIDTAAN